MSKARNIADSTKTLNIDGGTNTFIDLDKDDAGLSQVRFKNAGTLKFASWLNSDEDFIHYGTTGVAQIFYTGGTERMRISSSGSVGIGTSSPTHKAHILTTDSTPLSVEHSDGSDVYIKLVNNADGAGNFLGASSNNLTFWTENSERMRIDSSGRVAIGDTPKASFTGHSILQVGGQAILGANDALSTTGQTYLSHNLYFDTSGNYQVFNTGSANEGTVYRQVDGTHRWSNSAATTGTPSVQERMRIDASGNIGIGTSSPDRILHLNNSGTEQNVRAKFTNGTTGEGASDGFEIGINASNPAEAVLVNYEASPMAFFTSATERMRIDSSGNLLVGTTDANPGNNSGGSDVGSVLDSNGKVLATANSAEVMVLNRQSTNGPAIEIRKDGVNCGEIGPHGGGDLYIGQGGAAIQFFSGASSVIPYNAVSLSANDNAVDLGHPSYRWDDVYATNGTIQTSDRNEKQDIAELSDAEQRVAVAAKGLLRKFRWRDAVEAKGDEARTHFGIIAQDLQAAFAAEGLDAGDYAMFISSTWTDEETGEERTRMGVRYSELLAFIIAAI